MEPKSLLQLRPKLEQLINLGYKSDFTLFGDRLYSYDRQEYYLPDQVTIEGEYKFSEFSDNRYQVSLFKITCDEGERGTIIISPAQTEDLDLCRFMGLVKRRKNVNSRVTVDV